MDREELRAGLDAEPPSRFAIGRGNVLPVAGWCEHPTGTLRKLALKFDGGEHRVLAQRGRNFWGLVRVPARDSPARVELGLAAQLLDGERVERTLAVLELEPGIGPAPPRATARPAAAGGEPLACICMATCDPPLDLLQTQLDSLRAQADDRWICLIADDGSKPESLAAIAGLIDGDPRFELRRHGERLGAYRNFERALQQAPREAELIGFCDQDDRWYPNKLTALRAALSTGAALAFSDMRVVDRHGTVISPTYWSVRANNFTNLSDLVMVNTVTGAASLFRRELLDYALPFPEPGPDSFHDHWLAMVALATDRIAYVDRPLYDYVQHADAALGHRLANQPQIEPSLRERIGGLRDGERLDRWQRDLPYLLRVLISAEVLRMRCGDRMEQRKLRQLDRLRRLGRPARGLGWLGWRAARARPPASTMAKERQLLRAKLWLTATGLRRIRR